MKTLKLALAVGILGLVPTMALAQLKGTDHDFTQGAYAPNNPAGTQIGMCTYCHTPHSALTTLLLWNHTLSTNQFSWTDPNTTGGTPFAKFQGDTYTGPSAKCLSCHDGSVAVGDINWFSDAQHKGANALTTTKITGSHQIATAAGSLNGNHPVAMPYPYNNAKNTYNSVQTGDNALLSGWEADPSANNIRLFNDVSGSVVPGTSSGKTGIECSSCHEPHNNVAVVKDDMFLRGKLTGTDKASGYLCTQCHNK